MLKAAALLQLELMNCILPSGFMLKDATPYNIQFIGTEPKFIDIGSFEPYQEGAPWNSYAQFCRMFLNPLLLQSLTGVGYQTWLRNSLDGIDPNELGRVLSLRSKMRKVVFLHVVLQSWLNRKFAANSSASQLQAHRRVQKIDVSGMINSLKRDITRLHPRGVDSPWVNYGETNTYDSKTTELKQSFVERILSSAKPSMVWDLGCNTGLYSKIAAKHADWVIAMDSDASTVNVLYREVRDRHRNILPLVIDLLNPSPDQGWSQLERRGLAYRGPADFVLCLALVHHLALRGNLPIPLLIKWLSQVTRGGIIEFVPKTDDMVQNLLRWRKDIFEDYSQIAFESALREFFHISETTTLPNGRVLYAFSR
jgi:ribosomal protein L11 methylase PrmA